MNYIKEYKNTEEILKLWQEVFGDSREYIKLFLDNCSDSFTCHVMCVEKKPVSMLFTIPTEMVVGELSYSGNYIYAVCTHPKYRGRGLSNKLTEHANEYTKNTGGYFTALVPATPDLFEFYKKQGYENYFFKSVNEFELKEIAGATEVELKNAHLEEVIRMRNKYFSLNSAYIKWDECYLDHAAKEAAFSGGGILNYDKGYAFCYLSDETLYIKEICSNDNNIKGLVSTALKHYNKEIAIVSTIAIKDCKSSIPFGMIKFTGEYIAPENSAIMPTMFTVLD